MSDTIVCTFTVQGDPVVEVLEINHDFGDVFVNGTKTDTILIYNTGCDTLFVTGIASSIAEYTINETIIAVLPNDSARIIVNFTPTSISTFNSVLTIYNNDIDVTVNLTGNGISAPELSLSLNELNPIVTQCYDAITQQYTVNNNGNSNMMYDHSIIEYGFDESKAGEILNKYNNSYSYYGIVWVGEYLYGTDGNYLRKYDTINQSNNSYRIHNNARGIAYDGECLWIGNNYGIVYNYDLAGNAIGESFQLPFSGYASLTWDGQYFIAAQLGYYNPTIYKLNKEGSVIESFTTNITRSIYSLAYAQTHGDGKLWANTNNNEITQLKLVGSEYQKVNTLNYTVDNYNQYNLAYDGYSFWNMNWNYNLYQIDDGIFNSETWISLSDTSGIVNANSNQNIDITFSALNLNAGIYYADVVINSDDPVNTADTVACAFTVQGTPEIVLSEVNVDFGDEFVNGTKTDTILISNTGCETLFISDITSSVVEFASDLTTLEILPDESKEIIISFMPSSTVIYNSVLTIVSNDADAVISLTGRGISAPVASITPEFFNESVESCDGTVSTSLSIQNTGGNDLTFDIFKGYGLVKTNAILVIQESDSWNLYMADFLNSNFGIDPTVILSNEIATTDFNLFDIIITTGDQNNTYYNNISSNVSKFENFVNAGGIVQYQLGTQGANVDIVGGVNAIHGFSESINTNLIPTHPITNELPIELYGNNANHCYITNLPVNAEIVTETENSKQPTTVEYKFGAGIVIATGMIWEHEYMNNYNSGPMIYNSTEYCISLISGLPSWLTLSSFSGTNQPGSTTIIGVEFSASGLNTGVHEGELFVNTNDPVNRRDTIPVSFTVIGYPTISVNETALLFGDVLQNETSTRSFLISNTGCDTLKISNITSSLGEFTPDITTAEIMPGIEQEVIVTFAPTEISSLNGTLTITSNDGDVLVDLIGVGVEPGAPIITADLQSLNFGDVTIGTNIELEYTVSGTNLTEDIVVNAPTGYEVSTTSGSGYSSSLTLVQAAGEISETIIYVQFAPIDVQSYSDNVTNISSGATQVNIVVSGNGTPPPTVVTSVPSLDYGDIVVGSTSELSYTVSGSYLEGSIAINAPTGYEISTVSGSDFVSNLNLQHKDGVVNETTIYVQFSPVIEQFYFGDLVHNSTNAEQVDIEVSGSGVVPVIYSSESSIDFGDVEIATTDEINYVVSGSYLIDDIVLVAPTGFGLSTTSGTGFASTLTLMHSGGDVDATVYVQFAPVLEEDYSGDVTHVSESAIQVDVALFGTGVPPPPSFESTVSTIDFGDVETADVAEQSYAISGTYLLGNIVITAPVGYGVSTTSGTGFSSSISLIPTDRTVNATVYVQFAPTLEQAYSGNITNTSTGVNQVDISITGTGVAPGTPIITKSLTTLDFGDIVYETTSEEQNYTIKGTNLTENIVITALTDFEISEDNSDYSSSTITLVRTGSDVAETTIYVRFAPSDAIAYSDVIAHTSAGASTANVSVVGNGVCEDLIVTGPGVQNVCAGNTAEIEFTVAGSEPFTYVWKKGEDVLVDEGDITGATTNILSIATVATNDAGDYSCIITDLCNNVITKEVNLNVKYPVSITTQPNSITTCDGRRTSFYLNASGSNLTYQWKKDGVNIEGANASSYSIASTVDTDAGSYTCAVSGACGSATSNAATLTVNESVNYTTQPIGATLCEGEAKTFMVVASGEGILTYQWERNGAEIADENTASYVIGTLTTTDAGDYTCVVTGTCGSVTSDVAKLIVNGKAAITKQPEGSTICEGRTVTLKVTATYASSYQWKKGDADIEDATSASYRMSSVTEDNTGDYTCVVSNSCNSVTSNIVTVTVNAATMITQQPENIETTEGKEVSFSVAATGSNLTYQWRFNVSNIEGATENLYSIASVSKSDAGSYNAIVSGDCGNITSEIAVLSVTTSIDELLELGINIYPNPSEGVFNISFTQDMEDVEISIFNYEGKIIYQEVLSSVTNIIDLSDKSQGIYLVRFIKGDRSFDSRIIIE